VYEIQDLIKLCLQTLNYKSTANGTADGPNLHCYLSSVNGKVLKF